MHSFTPGEIVATQTGPLSAITHAGIYTDRHSVISNCRGRGVVEELFSEFSSGSAVRSLGYPGELPNWEVIERARGKIGHRWDLFQSNCEHFVTWTHGLNPHSPQLTKWLLFSSATAVALVVFLRFRK